MILRELGEKYSDYIVNTRRKFHACPETALEEFQTHKMICEELDAMNIEHKTLCGTGIIADIGREDTGAPTVALRADIDSLKVTEATGVSFASKREGYMHACGHDAHIAINLTSARILKDIEDQIPGKVRILFQPAEENAKGAFAMIDAGAIDDVDTIYGTHVWSTIDSGKIIALGGPRMASADFFTINIEGKAVHGSEPFRGVDPIAVAAGIINELQVAFTREYPALEPTLISFCQIHGGNADNAIPQTVTIGGTTRAFNNDIRRSYPDLINRVIKRVAEAFRAEATLDYRFGSATVINDETEALRVRNAAAKNYGPDFPGEFPPIMSGEDFAAYQDKIPGVMALLGMRNESLDAVYPQHSNHYTIDESMLIRGAVTAAQYAVDYMEDFSKTHKQGE